MKLWQGRLSGSGDALFEALNSSVSFDKRLVFADIKGSAVHAAMLGRAGIIPLEEASSIVAALNDISAELQKKTLEVDLTCEDVHTFLEAELTRRLGDVGKKVHTGRSRNDQVAMALRIYISDETREICELLRSLCLTFCDIAAQHTENVMPGYTHLQRAQPVTLAHYLMAFAQMFRRDRERLQASLCRTEVCVLGSGALAGTTYPADRQFESDMLGFASFSENSMDAVADRDFAAEYCFCLAMVMQHLSRYAAEVVDWCSLEFGFMQLADGFSSGSSIMPQKKNPDSAELIRGKCARVYADLSTLLTVMKGLPLAYNKDMQEDKEAVFDAGDTVKLCLEAAAGMTATAVFNTDKMAEAARRGFINATDCADYLTKKGVPFRDAYGICGRIVKMCVSENKTLEQLSLEQYRTFSDKFDMDIYDAIDILNCVRRRSLPGGPAPEAVAAQIEAMRAGLE